MKISDMEISLGFENVAFKQKKNIVNSRLDVNIRSEIIKGVFVDIPLMAANMSTVINANFYFKIIRAGGFAVLHRAQPKERYIAEVKSLSNLCEWVAASIGVSNDDLELCDALVASGANIVVIDIAHGYSDRNIEFGKKIKQKYPHVKLVIGNVINEEFMTEVFDFVDGIKVGIASGLACETKNTAGCTEKQFSAVWKFKEISKQYGIPIISDGGTREPADFTKAIGAGANSVMAGSIFAMCPDSAAEITEIDGKEKKIYAGMASRYVQDRWKGGLKPGTCPEGTVKYLDIGETVDKLLERYSGALKSGITYAGGKDIKSFQDNVEFIRLI